MTKQQTIILSFGALALVAFFVLVIFARSLLSEAINETRQGYEESIAELETQPADRFNTADPFVTAADSPLVSAVPQVLESDPVKGPLNAELTIIEYGDFECPFCAELAPVLDELLALNDKVRLVWKDLPNPLHLRARGAANAARCAQAQGQFWQYHDNLFFNQSSLGSSLYTQIAESLSLDLEQFSGCLESQAFDEVVIKGLEDLNVYNIDSTPYLFVGNERVDQLTSLPELQRLVDRELKR